MPIPLLLATAAPGAVGSALRYLVDTAVTAKIAASYPWGTTTVNVSGSAALGFLTGLASAHSTGPWLVLLGTGLIGGYTTFSTASVETVRLLLERRPNAGISNGLVNLAVCLAAAWSALLAGRLMIYSVPPADPRGDPDPFGASRQQEFNPGCISTAV